MKVKYTLVTLSLITLGSMAQAQIKKGTILLGGSLQYQNSKDENIGANIKDKSNTYIIQPAIGVAVKNNMVLGLQLGYSHTKSDDNNIHFTANGYTGSVFLRQYWNITSKFYAFGHVEAGYSQTKGKSKDSNNPDYTYRNKVQNIGASLVPGIAYSVSNKIQLESTFLPLLTASYSKSNTAFKYQANGNSTTENTFRVNGFLSNGQTFSLGVRCLL